MFSSSTLMRSFFATLSPVVETAGGLTARGLIYSQIKPQVHIRR